MITLHRNRNSAVIAGICSGLNDYFHIPAIIFRLIFLLLSATGGTGFLLYLLLWVAIPSTDYYSQVQTWPLRIQQMGTEISQFIQRPNPKVTIYLGMGLIIAGAVFLLKTFDFPWLKLINFDLIWPIAAILLGILVLFFALKKR